MLAHSRNLNKADKGNYFYYLAQKDYDNFVLDKVKCVPLLEEMIK